jgi:hypothetical protein
MSSNNEETLKTNNDEGDPDSFIQRFIPNVGNVFPTTGIRYVVQIDDGINRLVLGSRYCFLLYLRLFLVGVYLTYEILK